MGLETRCAVTVDDAGGRREDADAKVLLEGDAIIVRGAVRTQVPRAGITDMRVDGGALVVTHAEGVLQLALGDAAEKWRTKIAEGPRSRVEKLGVKAGMRVMLAHVGDPTIGRELAEGGATLVDEHVFGTEARLDMILTEIDAAADLARIGDLATTLGTTALWVIHPNGQPDINDVAVMEAGKRAGLVATKTMAFSTGMSAERLSVPKAK